MSTKIRLEYFGFDGTGATVKEAKQDAGRKIEALHQGTWEPVLVTWRGETALIFRTIHGFESKILQHDGEPLHMPIGCQMHGNDDRKTVIKSVQRHIVQLGWRIEDPLDIFPEWFTDEHDRKDAIRYRQWQLDYRKHVAAGLSDTEAHRAACDDMWRPRA